MPPKPSAKPAAKAPAAKKDTKPAAKVAAKPAAKPAVKAAAPTKAPTPAGNGVYVKGLGNKNVEEVKAIFQTAGPISQIRLRRNKFALVFFESATAVKKATDAFNGKDVQGVTLTVTAAKAATKSDKKEGTKTIFVSPLFRQSTTRNQIRELFKAAGKITKLRTYRGNFAFVTFDSAAAATKAIKEKNGSTFQNKKLLVKASVRK